MLPASKYHEMKSLLRTLSQVYDAAAWRRRRWYGARPDASRKLVRPVISVGALAVGGSGKTPLTAYLARTLVSMGERPAVLSRGYGRVDPVDGVTVVRDTERLVGDLATGGDEPWMLARSLDGVAVVVASDRYLAGRLAETHLGATVHLLDDGFQHLQLDRGTDLLIISAADLDDSAVLPAGSLRERLATIRYADALFLVDVSETKRRWLVEHFQPPRLFTVRRQVSQAVVDWPALRSGRALHPGTAVMAVAGIARPERFFEAVRASGLDLICTRAVPDHHPYTRRAAVRLQADARAVQAQAIVTTEKDFVRLESWQPFDPPLAMMPLTLDVGPDAGLRSFLSDQLAADRSNSGWG